MKAGDPRHSSVAGYRAGCRAICCKKAISRYNEQRKINLIRGEPTTTLIPALGSQRRLQALGALGWSLVRIADHAQIDRTYLRFVLRNSQRISTDLAAVIDRTYDALSMTLPPAETAGDRQSMTRTRKRAAALGWLPPLAWDDIDIDLSDDCPDTKINEPDLDEVLVRRAIDHSRFDAFFNTEERRAVVAGWTRAGRSLTELSRLSGWNVHRYTASPDSDAAA